MLYNQASPVAPKPVFKITKISSVDLTIMTIEHTQDSLVKNLSTTPITNDLSSNPSKVKKHKRSHAEKQSLKMYNIFTPMDELSLLIYHYIYGGDWQKISEVMNQFESIVLQAKLYELIDIGASVLLKGTLELTSLTPQFFVLMTYTCILFSESIHDAEQGKAQTRDGYILSLIKRGRLTQTRCEKVFSAILAKFMESLQGNEIARKLEKHQGIDAIKVMYKKLADEYKTMEKETKMDPNEQILDILAKVLNDNEDCGTGVQMASAAFTKDEEEEIKVSCPSGPTVHPLKNDKFEASHFLPCHQEPSQDTGQKIPTEPKSIQKAAVPDKGKRESDFTAVTRALKLMKRQYTEDG